MSSKAWNVSSFFINFSNLFRYCLDVSPVSMAAKLHDFIKDFKVSHPVLDIPSYRKEVERFPWKYAQNKNLIFLAFDVIERYQEFLSVNALTDEDDVYTVAAGCLKDLSFDTLIIDGIYEILPHQERFLKRLISMVPDVIAVYYSDRNATVDVREMILEKNLNVLKQMADWHVTELPDDGREAEIKIFNFPSPEEEVRRIAEKTDRLLREKSVSSLEEISVVFPSMPFYRPLVQRIFRRYGLPAKMTPGYYLNQDPSVIAVLSLFDCAETENWENLMNVFSSPFFSFDDRETEEFSASSREEFRGAGIFPAEEMAG